MRTEQLSATNGERAFVMILDTGEEVMSSIKKFATEQRLSAAQITAIGALQDAVLTYFNWEKRDYERIPVEEQVEVASMVGDIALSPKEEPAVHVHLVVGKRDGSAMAGHLAEAHVRPTLEVVIREAPAHLRRVHDPDSGLALIRPSA